ncbi:MAG: aminotransferase class I/II-fold pyridoxal phosphate-dependent enzyme, partial [Mesorhizobium sp.]
MVVSLSRRGDVEPFHAMDVLAEANRLKAKGVPVVSMAVGQPSDAAPAGVRQAATHALKMGRIGYTDALGLAGLREAIAQHYADHYGLAVSPGRIAVTTGSSAAFNLAFLAMFDPGADELSALVTTAQELGIAVISDEIYHRLAYAAPDTTALAYGPDVTVINSFSKYYCMTGWRIGWMVLPDPLVRPVERIAQSLYISPPELSQIAAIEAFKATAELEAVK